MRTAPKIESSNLSIADLFRDFYSVPDFQREYVWQKSNVERLLSDIYYELYEEDVALDDTEYFLGSIVVFRDEDKTFQLIDGQQRLTTIYLIFCVVRNLIVDLGSKSRALDDLIAGVTQDMKTGEDISRDHLSLQYDSDSAKFLANLADKKLVGSQIDNNSSSVGNLFEATKIIQNFVNERFIKEPKHLKQFSSALSNKVKVIRIETPNLSNALRVFETINERGIGLTPIDLLKNYLFINISPERSVKRQWSSLKSRWDKLLKNLYNKKEKEKPTRFLRYYIMSHYNVDLKNGFPEEDIYNWFVKEESYHRIHQDPIKFVDELIKASQHYRMFKEGKNTDGSHNRYLGNIEEFRGRNSQYFILLLAGRHLEKDLFVKLCEQVENLLFIYTFIRKGRSKDVNLTRIFSQWSEKLHSIRNAEQLSTFIEEHFKKTVDSWSSEFETFFKGLTELDIAKYRLRYILAKLSQFVDEKAYSGYKPLNSYLTKSTHIEHILPQSRKIDLIDNFDQPEEYDYYVKKLGNLTLLENSINSSISNKPYELKKQGYRHSQMLITRSLVEKPNVGSNTQINRSVENLELEQYDDWTSGSIDKRQDKLANLAKKVWGLSS